MFHPQVIFSLIECPNNEDHPYRVSCILMKTKVYILLKVFKFSFHKIQAKEGLILLNLILFKCNYLLFTLPD